MGSDGHVVAVGGDSDVVAGGDSRSCCEPDCRCSKSQTKGQTMSDELAAEIVRYEMSAAVVWSMLWAVVLTCAVVVLYQTRPSKHPRFDEGRTILRITTTLIALLALAAGAENITTVSQCILAPTVILAKHGVQP